jgi:hypothetical protein
MQVPGGETPASIASIARNAGLGAITMLAWRDLADTEAGGSEVHADRIASEWAKAGIDVTMRTSAARGFPREERRHGYRVIRRSGRIMPRNAPAGRPARPAGGPRGPARAAPWRASAAPRGP